MKTYNPKEAVELFHLLFLSQLSRKIDKKLYAVKGGCNMRFYFNSIRYSEDMDIDIQTINKDTLHKNVSQILNSIPFRNILKTYEMEIVNISDPKQTTTTQRWKVSLKSSASSVPLKTKIEFSRRNTFSSDVNFEVINAQILNQYSLPPIMANHYSVQSMYAQKTQALALRTETQSRDIFDLYLLINLGVNLKSQDKEIIKYLSIAKDKAKSISFADFKGQVIAYLPEDYQQQYDDKSIWNSIVEKVTQSLDENLYETN